MRSAQEQDGRQEVMVGFATVAAEDGDHFFYVKIPVDLVPEERRQRFDTPLNAALEAQDLGEVTGGGSQLSVSGRVMFCGLDVVVTDRDPGLRLILETLRGLNAPAGTVVEEYLPQRTDHPLGP